MSSRSIQTMFPVAPYSDTEDELIPSRYMHALKFVRDHEEEWLVPHRLNSQTAKQR
jgi:hypothetical protein